jgi:hypothetical protein
MLSLNSVGMLAAAAFYLRAGRLTAVSPRDAATMAAAPLQSPPAVPPARQFREVGPLSFSIVLMRLGVRPLLDGQPEEAFQLGPKGRESDGYVVCFCRLGFCARLRLPQSLGCGRCVLFNGRLLGPLRLEDAEQFGRVDSEASIVGPLRRKPAFPDGAPDVDFARSGLFRRFLKAQRAHCVPSRATMQGTRMGSGG